MAKSNSKKRRSTTTLEKTENIIKHKELEIAKAERKIKEWEDVEERAELKELHESIKAIQDIVQYPSKQLNDLANHLIREYKNKIGLTSTKERKNRLSKHFEIALWGKGPSDNEREKIKKGLSFDANSSIYKLFSDAKIGTLTNKEAFNSDGIKSESLIRRAILDWELALEKYEGLSDGARNILKADIGKLIHGEDVHSRKNAAQYENIPQYVRFYSNSAALSKGLKKYCQTMQKNANTLAKAYNVFATALLGSWNAIPLNEASLIDDNTILNNSLWKGVKSMVDNMKN